MNDNNGIIQLGDVTIEQAAAGGVWLTYNNMVTGQLKTVRLADMHELARWMWFEGYVEDYYATDVDEEV